MSQVTAKEKLLKQPADIRNYSMDFTNLLGGYDISSITYAASSPAGLTISNTGISIDKQSVNITVSGGTEDTDYHVAIRIINTHGTPETIEGDGLLFVRET